MMQDLSLTAVATACGVEWSGKDAVFSGVCIDSRKVQSGDLFVALRGERFDSHDFLSDVQQAGAVAALVEKIDSVVCLPQVLVKNSVSALGQVAKLNREMFGGKIIGLTGSAGKTTTKEMIAAILEQTGHPLVTAGNLNNHLGVPLSLLRLEPGHDSAVIEMGASALGEIAYLTRMTKPDVALVTTVAAAHIEGFGSIENVALGKKEIYAGLHPDGTAVINLDNSWTAAWQDGLRAKFRVLTFSSSHVADIFATDILQSPNGVRFVLNAQNQRADIALAFLGLHNVSNALAAAASCMALGIAFEKIVTGLHAARPYKGRLQSKHGVNGCLVIDDSYNANPASVRMAIDTLLACEGKKILVLGDMGELGVDARSMHADTGRYAKEAGIQQLLVTGSLSQATADAFGEGALHFDSWQSLADYCLSQAEEHSTFLIKGSRSAGMDRVADALTSTEKVTC